MKIIKKLVKIVIPMFVIVFIFFRCIAELETISVNEIIMALRGLTIVETSFAVIFGLFSVLVMSLYDAVLVKSLRLNIPLEKYIKIGFISNSINSVLGFGGIAGASIRQTNYRTYTNDSKRLLSGVTWMTTGALNGLSFFAMLILIHILPARQLMFDKPYMIPVLIGMACFAPIYFLLTFLKKRKNSREEENLFLMAKYFSFVSIIEWAVAAILLFFLLHLLGIDIAFRVHMGVFVIAAIAGVISFVPGGLGSFDLMFLLGMGYYGYNEEIILSALLLYRIVYYFIPFLIALILAVSEFLVAALKRMESKKDTLRVTPSSVVIKTYYQDFLPKIGYWSLCFLIFYAAWINITSALLRPMGDSIFSEGVVNFSYGATLAFALILMVNLRGIYYRTETSYIFVMISLIGSIVTHVVKGFDMEEAIILSIIVLILLTIRKQFLVENMVVSAFYITRTLLVISITLLIYFYIGLSLSVIELSLHIQTVTAIKETIVVGLSFVFMIVGMYLYKRIKNKEKNIIYNHEKI